MSSNFHRNFCAGIFLGVHLLEALFGHMLCISYIFVLLFELTLATFFSPFDICYSSPVCNSQPPLLAYVVLPLWVFVPRHCIHCDHHCAQGFPFLLCTQ